MSQAPPPITSSNWPFYLKQSSQLLEVIDVGAYNWLQCKIFVFFCIYFLAQFVEMLYLCSQMMITNAKRLITNL